MRYWVYDEDGHLIRKFWDKWAAERFMQEGWTLVVQPKPKRVLPTAELYGEAPF